MNRAAVNAVSQLRQEISASAISGNACRTAGVQFKTPWIPQPAGHCRRHVQADGHDDTRDGGAAKMKHALYEDPVTHKFGLLRLPSTFKDGDKLPTPPIGRWFDTREEAVAALSQLLNQEE
jgi:hypothetical protein